MDKDVLFKKRIELLKKLVCRGKISACDNLCLQVLAISENNGLSFDEYLMNILNKKESED